VFRTEKLISENADKISDDTKKPVEEAIAEVKSALEGDDNDRVKAAVEKLNTASATLGQAMYAAAQQSQAAAGGDGQTPGSGEGAGSESSEEDVVDAEIVDEEKPQDSSSTGEAK
jgi:molecular chaperone DnaK